MSDSIKIPGRTNVEIIGKESGTLKKANLVTRTDSIVSVPTDPLFGIKAPGIQGNVSIPTANTPVEVKVGAGRLTNRRMVTVQPLQANTYWGYTSGVTSSNGTKMFKDQVYRFLVQSDTVTIFLVCTTSSANMRVTEAT
jgi:hypothetical protein